MKYKVVKYKKKNVCPFETYEPERKIKVSRDHAVPLLVRTGNRFVMLGGMISFFASSLLMSVRSLFNMEKKIKNFSLNKKVVELRVKRYD